MKYYKLKELRSKLFFTVEDVATLLGIKTQSSAVLCSRYTKMGYFIRVKKDLYVLEQAWQNYSEKAFLDIIYLCSFCKYKTDFSPIDIDQLTSFPLIVLLCKNLLF